MSEHRRAEPRHERHALASGVALHCVHWDPPSGVESVATPWLLVHGLASNARLWDGVAWRLAQQGHKVVAVDQRGHGRSDKPDGPYDMQTVADDLDLLLTHLTDTEGWTPPGVAGQSWGGNVVLELGYRHPDTATVIACVDGGTIELQDRFPRWEDAERALAPPVLVGTPVAEFRTRLDMWAGDWPQEGRDGTLANFEVLPNGTISPWLTYERHLQVLRGLWEHSPRTRYAHIDTPLLFVSADSGDDDDWTAAKRRGIDEALIALRSARSEWFVPAHHDVHAQRPDDVATLLRSATTEADFFGSTSSKGSPT